MSRSMCFLRVHSYSTKAASVSAGLDVPDGVEKQRCRGIEFYRRGDRYAKITLVPPKNLAAGNYTIAAFAKRGEEKIHDFA